MTAKEAAARIGLKGTATVNNLVFKVTIQDVKFSYGNLRYLVSVDGQDVQTWINEESITLDTQEKQS